jgi:hypothetical protein
MIHAGKVWILWDSEMRKFQKLHKIFRHYSEADLDLIVSGKMFLRRAPRRKAVTTEREGRE